MAAKTIGNAGLWSRENFSRPCATVLLGARPSSGEEPAAALQAVTNWTRTDLRIHRDELFIDPWNNASIHTAEGGGCLCEGLLRSRQHIGDSLRDMFEVSRIRSARIRGRRSIAQRSSLGFSVTYSHARFRSVPSPS